MDGAFLEIFFYIASTLSLETKSSFFKTISHTERLAKKKRIRKEREREKERREKRGQEESSGRRDRKQKSEQAGKHKGV